MYNRQIKTFIQVADSGSFTSAAEKLFVTSASVMKQMNALESRIGVKLLERTNHGVVLTPSGRSIYKDAKKIISESEDAIERARQIAGKKQCVIRIGTSLLNPCKTLIDLWSQISSGNTEFQIRIIPFEDDSKHILSVISSLGKDIDFIVGACGSSQWHSRCSVYLLGQYGLCCAVPRKHKLAGKTHLSISDLYGETLMMGAHGDTPELDNLRDMIEREHPQISIMDTVHFYDAEVFNTCEHLNSILLTLDAWQDVHPSLITIPVDWDYTVPYGLLYSKMPSRNVTAFLAELDRLK
ncbi:MAG: LysR family transcriptional regulator [Oscillospiraceae bacterium]|nr:LysR family transcriptional regulator [Oscillospiraceae bacterium]